MPEIDPDSAAAPTAATPQQPSVRREVIRTILINAVTPYVVYVLASPHVGGMQALLLSAVAPVLESLWSVARRRRLDLVAALVLGGIAASLGLMALGGSERVLLLRESLVTGLVGLFFVGSVPTPKPFVYVLGRHAMALRDPERCARWERRFDSQESFRRSMRVLTAVWGVGLLVEVGARTGMVLEMRVADFLLVSPFVQYGLTGALILWTVVYARRMRRDLPPAPA